jgi:hypothetical protein
VRSQPSGWPCHALEKEGALKSQLPEALKGFIIVDGEAVHELIAADPALLHAQYGRQEALQGCRPNAVYRNLSVFRQGSPPFMKIKGANDAR